MSASKALAVVLVAGGAALAAGPVGAHTKSYPTTVVIEDFLDTDMNTDSDTVIGTLSTKEACRQGRRLKFYLDDGVGGYTLFDTDRTNRQGNWRGGTDNTIGDGGKARVLRKNVGSGDHNHVCKGDTELWD